MLIQVSQNELNTIIILTLILLMVKIAVLTYLGLKIIKRKKEQKEFSYGFLFSVFIVFLCLLISRCFYMDFDFVLTRYDATIYYQLPNVLVWKIASAISQIGFAQLIFIIDYRLFHFKFKGIFAYGIAIILTIQFFYPVKNTGDFQIISAFNLFSNVIAIIIPAFFFYMGRKKSPYQVASWLIAIGVILYAIGSNIVIEALLKAIDAISPGNARIILHLVSLGFKISGLVMFSYGVVQFTRKISM
ncbi:MAG: hypothetical protein ACTSYS_06010 [Promethearchaeota archaeon]